VLVIIFGVDEPESPCQPRQTRLPINRANLRRLPKRFWWVVVFAAVLTLARFSEAFLLLRAQNMGLAVTWVPMILIVMNLVYAASAYPLGKLSDNGDRSKLLAWGIGFLILSDLVLALAGNIWTVGVGAALWGLHMGATQGLLSALVAEAAPADLRGTAFGVFNLASGVALLAASIIAGGLWSLFGPAMTFYVGAGFSSLALAGLFINAQRGRRQNHS